MSSVGSLTQTLINKMESESKKEEMESTWHDIALLLDHIFLVIYLVLTIALSIFLLGVCPQVGDKTWEPLK